jgi:pimeloyl-ACP methyl ester carboxylesterase
MTSTSGTKTWLMAALVAPILASCGGREDVAYQGELKSSRSMSAAAPLPQLDWQACGDGTECTRAAVPLDYEDPTGRSLSLAVARHAARDPSRRIGVLFVNFGGPGATAASDVQNAGAGLDALAERFDIIGFDPRGVGDSENAIDCHVDPRLLGLTAQPFTTPQNLETAALTERARRYVSACLEQNAAVAPYVSTANVARDMDLLRAALGEDQISYLGISYGTFLGATYAALFPDHYRALVLDGAVDAERYLRLPLDHLFQQTAASEHALDRFFQACALDQVACSGFGGSDPSEAFDELLARARVSPLPVANGAGEPITADDILLGALEAMGTKRRWGVFASSLAAGWAGDGRGFRFLADFAYGRYPDGSFDPSSDRYFMIRSAEGSFPSDVETYLQQGKLAWSSFQHFWWNTGYASLPQGLFPVRAQGVYAGPFAASTTASPVLVIGTTFDAVTPYREAQLLTNELGNARLLTMNGDAHRTYPGESRCIDASVEAYLFEGTVPPEGTVCDQDTAFEQFPLSELF